MERALTSEALAELRERVAQFVREVVIPAEGELAGSEVPESLRARLQDAARERGVFAPHVSPEFGGLGMGATGQAAVFEEAGYSLLGPLAINAAAPDEGNLHLLEVVASVEQRERYLRRLALGEVRSCFAMTEPAPGAGSDPAALRTKAVRTATGWVINGRKWFTTGSNGAAFAIVMAKTAEIDGRRGATMFLVDTDNPGWRPVRHVETLDGAFVGGHGEIELVDCEVDDAAVLGEVDLGFEYAQVRLGPARLTHCMRWLGIARRSQDVALEVAADRQMFGARLGELGMAQQMIADNEIDIVASRQLIRSAAEVLEGGSPARNETSIAKVFVAEAANRVVDRAIQLCGGRGVSHDLPLARFLNEIRAFRIYDGPSEVHRWAIARRALRNATRP